MIKLANLTASAKRGGAVEGPKAVNEICRLIDLADERAQVIAAVHRSEIPTVMSHAV